MINLLLYTLVMILSLSNCFSSIVVKSLIRRQIDPQYCRAIEGFDCKCSYYRVTCTNDREFSSPIVIIGDEKGKYQSVELVLTAARDIHLDDRTFEPVKDLYKIDGDNLEFRVKFERFTSLDLSSPSIFNRVFPENTNSNVRKHIALEIYNPEVQPKDNVHLFQNLNVDTLELYALYPFHGSFQQLFNGANIKYLRLSGGDIRSDLSQSFTGNIARLELAKQASALSTQNFPVYPAHEMIINAFYVTEFNVDNPPNYQNLVELRIHSPERIPANAFRQFSNIHSLTISTDQDIDSQAFNGLNHLEKLTIKDTKPSIDLLNHLPQIKEFETNIEKLDERTQCQFLEKLANGQIFVQAIPNGRECTCLSAYLDTAMGRTPCDAQHCEHSQCSVIQTNYDSTTRQFRIPPPIRRVDGSDASRQRESKVYTSSYQIPSQDQEKLHRAFPSHSQSQQSSEQHQTNEQNNPYQSNNDKQNNEDSVNNQQDGQVSSGNGEENVDDGGNNVEDSKQSNRTGGKKTDGDENITDDGNTSNSNVNSNNDGEKSSNVEENGEDTAGPAKKGMSWLPIIIIIASIVGLLLLGGFFLLLRKKRANKGGYQPSSTQEPARA